MLGDEVLRVEGLSSPGKFEDVSFSLRAGEVLGIAGLVGAGRSELAHALFGLDPVTRGAILMRGKAVQRGRAGRRRSRSASGSCPRIGSGRDSCRRRAALHNLSLADASSASRDSRWLRRARGASVAKEFFDRLRVRAPSLDTVVAGLSGGNQQKIVLARWLAAQSQRADSR